MRRAISNYPKVRVNLLYRHVREAGKRRLRLREMSGLEKLGVVDCTAC